MADTVIEAVKDYLSDYIEDADTKEHPLWVNFLKAEPVEYSIVPLGGARKVSEYIHGNSGEREFVFALQSGRFTADEAERVGNLEFFETLAEWMDDQSDIDNLPSLPAGFAAHTIEAISYGYVFEQGGSETAVYQIQCRLEYSKQ